MDEDESSFGSLVFGHAVSETWKFFKSAPRDIAMVVLSIVIGFGAFWYLKGLPVALDQLLSVLLFTTLPFTMFVVSVFLWNMWLAPAALSYEHYRRGGAPQLPLATGKIDWAPWRLRQEYTLSEFARILARLDPTSSDSDANSRTYFELLKEAMNKKELKYTPSERAGYFENSRGAVTGAAKINRANAITWAKEKKLNVSHIDDPIDFSPLFRPS